MIQELLAERDKLVQEVEDLKQTSVKSLWLRDLDALEAKVIEEKNKYLIKWEADRKRIQVGATVSGPSQKNPRKKNQKTSKKESSGEQMDVSETMTETGNVGEIKKPRAKAAAKKKAPAAKVTSTADKDDDDEISDLRQRMAAYNFDSSPDRPDDMETEVVQMPATNKQPNKRGAAKKKPSSSVSEIDNNDDDVEIIDDDDDDDDDFETGDKKRKGGRKPANAKAAKPPDAGGAKKRAPASKPSQLVGQKLITEVLQPAENSPEKKVRKMRASPFNKKSSSILGRTINIDDEEEEEEEDASENSASTLGSASDAAAAAASGPAVARPKRATRVQKRYVISDDSDDDDSDDDEEDAAEELDSEFSDDE